MVVVVEGEVDLRYRSGQDCLPVFDDIDVSSAPLFSGEDVKLEAYIRLNEALARRCFTLTTQATP